MGKTLKKKPFMRSQKTTAFARAQRAVRLPDKSC